MFCRELSEPGASFGHCREHQAELLTEHYPDGTLRYRDAGGADRDPGYLRRLDAATEAHEQAERARASRQQHPVRGGRSR